MTHEVNTEQAVATLLGERQRYEAWLAALEAKRANTPQHIYQRVHADYSARLQRVVEQLVTHRTAIQEMANTLVDRLTSLDIDEAKHRDERAEAEVRAAVGEITPEVCTQILERTDGALGAINEERTSITTELTRFRALLDAGMEMSSRPRASGPTTAAPSPSGSPSFDELEFLQSVVEHRNGSGGAGNGTPPLEVMSNVMPEPPAPSASPAPAAEMGGFEVEHSSSEPVLSTSNTPDPDMHRVSGEAPRGRETRESVPSFLKDVPPEQVKTLKCQECGTLNYPTEWYCERCGAELAAL
jgi:hypothetical protein